MKELEPSVEELAYVGFRIPKDFVVGYGLDVAERTATSVACGVTTARCRRAERVRTCR